MKIEGKGIRRESRLCITTTITNNFPAYLMSVVRRYTLICTNDNNDSNVKYPFALQSVLLVNRVC